MQWFRHPSNFRCEPKLRAIEKMLGEVGYARAVKLFEIVAEQGSKSGRFAPAVDLKTHTDPDWFATELRISVGDLQSSLDTFAAVELIDPEDWRNQVVRIPQMKNHLDEYTQRQLRSRKSRQTPDRVPIKSPTPDEVSNVSGHTMKAPRETADTQRKKGTAIAADLRLKEKAEGCWKPLGLSPCGSVEFQEIWQRIWEGRGESEKPSYVMERCIQVCEGAGVDVKVPSIFRRAWKAIAEEEFQEEMAPFYAEKRTGI